MAGWKKNMVRILKISAWCAVATGAFLLLNAAMQEKGHQVCRGYEIDITGADEQIFMDKQKVEVLLFGKEIPMNKPVVEFNLKDMERKLKSNIWVRDAQLFFDNNEKLQIRIQEREPIARVFTVRGNSFYIDSSGARLPLSENQPAHLLVYTNFPVEKGNLKRADSLLMRQMIAMSVFVNKDPFWSAQVQQIDIASNKTFELFPLVGNHVVVFGNGDQIEEKFNRLFLFYKQVMAKTGFDHYERLDVQYTNQVVATKKAAALSKQDSLLAVQKVKQLIAEAQQMKPDTLMQAKVRPLEKLEVSEQTLANYDLLPVKTDTGLAETPGNPGPVKTFSEKDSIQNMNRTPVKKEEKKKEEKPKAVMQKRGF
jgi:cell division protein FtsQ